MVIPSLVRVTLLVFMILAACKQSSSTDSARVIDSTSTAAPPGTASSSGGDDTETRAAILKGVSRGRVLADACSTPAHIAPSEPEKGWVLTVNARQCLSCQQVGFLLRSIERSAKRAREVVMVVATASDSAAICDYLGRERSTALVTLLHDPGESLVRVVADSRFTLLIPDEQGGGGKRVFRETNALALAGVVSPGSAAK